MKRSNWRIGLYLLTVFVSGMLVGGFGHRVYTVKAVTEKPQRRPSPEEWRQRYVGEMQSRLKLDGEQIQSLNRILDETRQKFHAARERHRPEFDQIQQVQTSQIRAMLKPEQHAEYEKFREERERRMRSKGHHK